MLLIAASYRALMYKISFGGADRVGGENRALDDQMRQIFEQHAIFFAARFVFTTIQHQITRLLGRFAGKLPFFSGGKSRAAAAAQTGVGNNLDNFFGRSFHCLDQGLVATAGAVLRQSFSSLRDAMREKDAFHDLENPRIEKLVNEFFERRIDGVEPLDVRTAGEMRGDLVQIFDFHFRVPVFLRI